MHFRAVPESAVLATPALFRWEKIGIGVLLLAIVVQGVNVTNRSNFLERRLTDLGVYLRAGWAAQHDLDLYSITDENKFPYIYPPFFSILMMPLAEPPPGSAEGPRVPFVVATVVWYVFSIVCGILAIHLFASVLEKEWQGADERTRRRRWWSLRVIPFMACLPPIFATLVHGQVNLHLLLLIAGFAAASLRGRSLIAGLCLAAAACLKIFPAFLILYPLWRRDVRCLAGFAAGVLVLVVVIPTLAWGPERAWEQHRRFAEVVLLPSVGLGDDQTLAKDLAFGVACDSQSLQAILHNTLYLGAIQRPRHASLGVRVTVLLLGGLLTALVLWAAGRPRNESAIMEFIFVG
jgi:hypothetical protein